MKTMTRFLIPVLILLLLAGCAAQGQTIEPPAPAQTAAPTESAKPTGPAPSAEATAPAPDTEPDTRPAEVPTAPDAMPDFTVTTIDGGSFTLSQARQEKDLVLINLWATWCPPCRMEFPYLQEAYLQYQDRVAVIALSVEPTDTADVLTAFAEEYGLTFPIANDGEADLATYFQVNAIPTSVLVDRSGRVVWQEVGAQTSAEAFAEIFETYLP